MQQPAVAPSVARELEQHGVVVLHDLIPADQLQGMQRVFEAHLNRLDWNDFEGYFKNDLYRHMVNDVLRLHQGFVDLALHPVVKDALHAYIGPGYALAEAKGWWSRPTTRDFHGWHGDAWYDQEQVDEVQREVKLALYLTDVRSGAFAYVKGTHRQKAPRMYRDQEVAEYPEDEKMEITGRAGTVILFDTSGIHRQSVPILEPRQAVFYCYHDPSVPLQKEDVEYYRYHPLILNAAFLGNLSDEDQRILGFGDKTNYRPAFVRRPRHEGFQNIMSRLFDAKLRYDALRERVTARLRRTFGSR